MTLKILIQHTVNPSASLIKRGVRINYCVNFYLKHGQNPYGCQMLHQSRRQTRFERCIRYASGRIDDRTRVSVYEIVRSGIEAQIEADKLKEEYGGVIDEVVENITEVMLSSAPTLRVAGEHRPCKILLAQFSRIKAAHVEAVLWNLRNRAVEDITDIKAYIRTLLYNSLFTVEGDIMHEVAQEGTMDLN